MLRAAISTALYQTDYAQFVWHWITGLCKHQMQVKCNVLTKMLCFGPWKQEIIKVNATVTYIYDVICYVIVLSSLCRGLLSYPEAAGLVPGKSAAETSMCAWLLGWAQRECFLTSSQFRSCYLMPWRRAWAAATFLFSLQCLLLCP